MSHRITEEVVGLSKHLVETGAAEKVIKTVAPLAADHVTSAMTGNAILGKVVGHFLQKLLNNGKK